MHASLAKPLTALIFGALIASAGLHAQACHTTAAQVATVETEALNAEQTICALDALESPNLPATSDAGIITSYVLGVCASQIPQTLTGAVSALVTLLLSPPDAGPADISGNAFRTRLARMRAAVR